MPFSGPPSTAGKPTPNRKSRIRFGRWGTRIIEPAFTLSREALDIGTAAPSSHVNTIYVDGKGIMLKPISFAIEEAHELGNATPVSGTVADSFFTVKTFRQDALPGVTYSGGVSIGGDHYQKRVAAGDTFDQRLSADETAYERPDVSHTVEIDRVFVSDLDHDPEDTLTFSYYAPGVAMSILDTLGIFYFSGPASNASGFSGNGQFALACGSGGRCKLYERNNLGEWHQRMEFMLDRSGPGIYWYFSIVTNCVKRTVLDPEDEEITTWKGSTITIVAHQTLEAKGPGGTGQKTMRAVAAAAAEAISATKLSKTFLYQVGTKNRQETTPDKVRVDLRRDVRVLFNQFGPKYPESGTVTDQIIQLPFYPIRPSNMRVDIYCDRPLGTSITATLINAESEDILTQVIVVDDEIGLGIDFEMPAAVPDHTTPNSFRLYQLTITLNSNAGQTKTPFVTHVNILRGANYSQVGNELIDFPARSTSGSNPHLPLRSVSGVSITSENTDPASSSANFDIADLTATALQIRDKAGIPVDIDVLDDDNVIITRLFRGETATSETENIPGRQTQSTPLPEPKVGYPAKAAWRGSIPCHGAWKRLYRQLTQNRLTLLNFDDLAAGYKVTDAIRALFVAMGVEEWELDIPDLPIKLLNDTDDPIVIEPDTRFTDVIQQLVRDYLGGIIVRDENARGADDTKPIGMWRLMTRPKAPFRRMLLFTRTHPSKLPGVTPGTLKLPEILSAYPVLTDPDDQLVQVLPVIRPTKTVEPPEGNAVIVIGGNRGGTESGAGESLVQLAVNVNSFNALNLSSSDPKYPQPYHPDTMYDYCPIVVTDATLSSPEAVNWVCRRTFEAACYSQTTRKFESILPFITDVNDPLQVRPRMPRIGDMCEYEDEDGEYRRYVIVSCNPRWRKAYCMMADFEISRSETLDNYDFVNPYTSTDYKQLVKRLLARSREMMGINAGWSQSYEQNRRMSTSKGVWSVLPVSQALPPIQDLDPTSVDFGKFIEANFDGYS